MGSARRSSRLSGRTQQVLSRSSYIFSAAAHLLTSWEVHVRILLSARLDLGRGRLVVHRPRAQNSSAFQPSRLKFCAETVFARKNYFYQLHTTGVHTRTGRRLVVLAQQVDRD